MLGHLGWQYIGEVIIGTGRNVEGTQKRTVNKAHLGIASLAPQRKQSQWVHRYQVSEEGTAPQKRLHGRPTKLLVINGHCKNTKYKFMVTVEGHKVTK
jgi:hypothetical protein